MVFPLVVLVLLLAVQMYRERRERKRAEIEQFAIWNSQNGSGSFNDEEFNLSPRRDSAVDSVPLARPGILPLSFERHPMIPGGEPTRPASVASFGCDSYVEVEGIEMC